MMLWTLIQRTEWRPLLELLSPAFFDVIPARLLAAELRGLAARYLDASAYREAREERMRLLGQVRLPFEIVDALPGRADVVSDVTRGEDLLTLYFHQVLGEGPVLLDLRRGAFERSADRWLWRPAPAIAVWEPDFRAGLSALYEGFYLDDAARFSRGARALGLGDAEAELREQFGDARSVRFSLPDFQHRFHRIFERCKEARAKIHPRFLTLGLCLATLYEHLESIGSPLDVHAAFERVHRHASACRAPR
jgi:hypothetical protein